LYPIQIFNPLQSQTIRPKRSKNLKKYNTPNKFRPTSPLTAFWPRKIERIDFEAPAPNGNVASKPSGKSGCKMATGHHGIIEYHSRYNLQPERRLVQKN
jgi:hypothetical protein